MGAGSSALSMRVHHCIGDSIALKPVLNSMSDGGSTPPEQHQQPREDSDWLTCNLLRPIGVETRSTALRGDSAHERAEG